MRKPRLEIEGGLYHVITRGNNQQLIFGSDDDHHRFLLQLALQKARLPFRLYAYCLMPNHIHLLLERLEDPISRIMQRLLTAYSQYHNRKYRKSGHLLQGRYKAILCQSDQYLAELVRYIHLNPVRARMVRRAQDFRYSSHRAYMGQDESSLVDSDPVLRHFGATKKLARERFGLFVRAGMKLGHREEFYCADEGRILGSEEWVAETKNRIGEVPRGARPQTKPRSRLDPEALMRAAEKVTGLAAGELYSGKKSRALVIVKEAAIVAGRELGVSNAELARLLGLDASVVSRRYESGKARMDESRELQRLMQRLRVELAGKDSG
jgi:REP element-mobilizing transposase RayT